MRIQQTGLRLVAKDTPGCLWLFGLVFVSSGTFVLASVPFSAEWAGFTGWERTAILAIGISHLGAGLWLIRSTPATVLELDRTRGLGTHRLRHPGDRDWTVTRFPLADLRDVNLLEGSDSDGDPTFAIRLVLADGRELRLHGATMASKTAAEGKAREIGKFIGR
jgi:hypothetical protein